MGVEKSCHIPRDHGIDISIMAEIVDRHQLSTLFPRDVDSSEDSSDGSKSCSGLSQGSGSDSEDDKSLKDH